MLAVEVAKIKMARFLEEKEDVKVYVLAYETRWSDNTLLNEEFKSNYFQDQDERIVNIGRSFGEVIQKFVYNHGENLSDSQNHVLQEEQVGRKYHFHWSTEFGKNIS